MIRISQDIPEQELELYTFVIDKINETDEITNVVAGDIKCTKNDKSVKIETLLHLHIVLCRLRPGEFLKIDNIKIVKGLGIDDSGKFKLFSNIRYKILDAQPLSFYKEEGKSSLVTNPKKFYISYSTHRNITNPSRYMVKCCETLINRLNNVLNDMKNISDDQNIYLSSLLELETNGKIKTIKIMGEYWTLANLISRYCFIVTEENIKFVAPSIIHPDKRIGVVRIIHSNFSKVIQDAI